MTAEPWLIGTLLLAVTVAYVVFSLVGFGSALVAGPVLAHVMPVASVVPLLALLDVVAALANGVRLGASIDRREMATLVPPMLVGNAVGVTLLVRLAPRLLLLLLGLFVIAYAAYSLVRPTAPTAIARIWALPVGLVGGVFSAMFGSGGVLYAIYLSGRLPDATRFRATQTAIIGVSTFTRAVAFAAAGLYFERRLLTAALVCAPAMLLGLHLGRRIDPRLSRERLLRVLSGVLLLSGGSLVARYLGIL